jgi:two-component system alkaline phosphatase synthesis response regulator PhoP
MPRETILLIEDEKDIIEVLQYNLEREGYTVISATNGEKGLELARDRHPCAVILDLMLPGLGGLEVAQRLRRDSSTRDISILMLTAKGEESDVVLGLGVGADDYITKPFRFKEVLARLQAVLRRGPLIDEEPTDRRIERNGLVIDPSKYKVTVDGVETTLTLTEFKLLSTLAANPGRVYTRHRLLERIQGDAFIDERNIDVHVRSIRKKLGSSSALIVTVRGVGYRFQE